MIICDVMMPEMAMPLWTMSEKDDVLVGFLSYSFSFKGQSQDRVKGLNTERMSILLPFDRRIGGSAEASLNRHSQPTAATLALMATTKAKPGSFDVH